MFRLTIPAVCCAAVAGALALVSGTNAQSPASPSGTIELVQRGNEGSSTFVDNPPRRREGAGDIFAIRGPVRDGEGAKAGSVDATFVQTGKTTAQGTAVIRLADGHVVASGVLLNRPRTDTLAIVGGTGAYEGAGGTLVITEERSRTRFTLTFAG